MSKTISERVPAAVIQRYIPHYRLPFFSRLSQTSKYRWEFIYGAHPGRGQSGQPVAVDSQLISHSIRNIEIEIGKRSLTYQTGILDILRRKQYHVVVFEMGWNIISNFVFLPAIRRRGIATVGWSKGIADNGRERPYWRKICERWMANQCDALLVYGEASARYFRKLGVASRRIFIARNTVDVSQIAKGIDKARSQAVELRRALQLHDKPVVGYLGRLGPQKRVRDIIEAFIRAGVDAYLVIAGDGRERGALQSLAASSPASSRIVFLGSVPVGEESAFFQMFDLFVSARSAGLGILEAMANAKPCLITPEVRPETELVVDNVTGFIAADCSVSSLAASMRFILHDLPRARVIGTKAQAKVLACAPLERMIEAFDAAADYAIERSS